MYEIVATPCFKLCLERLIHFLETKHSPQKAQKAKSHIKKVLTENLSQNPNIARVSDRLVDIGIKEYRQYRVDEHNMVFYRINEYEKQVILLAVMDSRQNIQKLLLDVLLLA